MKQYCHVVFERFPLDPRVRRYVNSLLEVGVKVFVICIGNDSEGSIGGAGSRLKIFRLPLKKRRSSLGRRIFEYLVFELYSFLMVTYVFFRYHVRTYHVHTLPDFLVFSCLIPRLFGSRVILDFHELFPEFMMQYKPGLNLKSFLVRAILIQERLSFKFATDIIVFHDPAKEILGGRIRSRKPITVVMNAVDASEMPEIKRHQNERFRIVYHGVINFNLNLEIVVEALAAIKVKRRDIYDNLQFDLYGDGPALESILSRAHELGIDNVSYRGRIPFDEMMKELASASVCVLPPAKDIYSDLYYSLKLTEMVYLRIPVIATRLNTYLRYYPDNCLLYFDSGDVEGLARQICHVFESPEETRERAESALKRYQDYSWPVMRDRYLRLVDRSVPLHERSLVGVTK